MERVKIIEMLRGLTRYNVGMEDDGGVMSEYEERDCDGEWIKAGDVRDITEKIATELITGGAS